VVTTVCASNLRQIHGALVMYAVCFADGHVVMIAILDDAKVEDKETKW